MLKKLNIRKNISIIILAILALAIAFIKYHKNNLPVAENAVIVDVSQVKQGNIPIEAQAIGTLSSAQNVEITPEMAGHVARIFFIDGGVFVKKGTPLVQLDDASFQAKLSSDQANFLYSKVDYNRKVFLGKKGAIAQQAIDQALADLKTREASVQQSLVDVRRMLLVAPFDGTIGKINISTGDYVAAGQKIMTLTDTSHLHVDYAISEKYLSELKAGQKVKIKTSAYPGKEFIGKVAFISPTINSADRTISIYAEIPNDEKLLTSGLFVDVTQELGIENSALIIPAGCLVPTIDGQQVFTIINHKAHAVSVEIGQREQNSVQILSGLSLGDQVVTAGQQKLKEGAIVQANAGSAS